jgi:uncharacterized protein
VLDAALQFGATPLELVLSAGAIFGAAVVRGYTGFGFSMIAVTTLSMLRFPAEVVPMVLLLVIVASLHLLPSVWHAVEWRSLGWLLLGTMVATPAGVAVLTIVPANAMRVLVCVAVASAVVFLWRGFELRRTPGPAPTVATGVLVGILNGSTVSVARRRSCSTSPRQSVTWCPVRRWLRTFWPSTRSQLQPARRWD